MMQDWGWRIGDYDREASVLVSKERQLSIGYTPCNYGEKLTFSILPVPAPLGVEDGFKTGRHFVILFSVRSIDYEFLLDPASVVVTTDSGVQLHPIAYAPDSNSHQCDRYAGNGINSVHWVTNLSTYPEVKKYTSTNTHYISIALLYEMAPPELDDKFVVSVKSLVREGKILGTPDVYFGKGSAWGGW
jgi:hypothetical protein